MFGTQGWAAVGLYRAGLTLLLLLVLVPPLMAQTWPQRPVKFIVTLGAGSGVTAYAYLLVRRRRNMMGAGLLSFGFSLWGLYLTCYPFLELSAQLISMAFFISALSRTAGR